VCCKVEFSATVDHPSRGVLPSVVCITLLTEYCAGGKIEKNEMGGACGAYGTGERGVQGSGRKT